MSYIAHENFFLVFFFLISGDLLIKLEIPKPKSTFNVTLHSTVISSHCSHPIRQAHSSYYFMYMNDIHLEEGLKRNEMILHLKKAWQNQILQRIRG